MSRTRRASLVLLVAVLASVGLGAGGSAYQFLWEDEWRFGAVDFSAEPNISWSLGPWPRNGTLSFVLEDSPWWGLDIQEVRRIAEEAMAFWSGIPSADIRWEVGRIASVEEARTRVNRIAIAVGDDSHARVHTRVVEDRHEIIGCRIAIRPILDEARLHSGLYGTLVHELGHCLGLAHPAPIKPDTDVAWEIHRRENGDPLPDWWGLGPVMGAAGQPREPPHPSDRIGASLLRPRPGWLRSVGSLYGNVFLDDGERAAFVRILVSKLRDDGTLEQSFVRITDANGAFVVGGLDTGRYVLLAGPLGEQNSAFWDPLGATRAVRATVLAMPVSVSADRRTGPVTLTMRRGENLYHDWR